MKPYFSDDFCTIYHGDCREILPTLPKADLVLTDPPYGIKQDAGMGGGGFGGFGKRIKRNPKAYQGGWDSNRPTQETISMILQSGTSVVVWGGNYFSDLLPVNGKWLVWDKEQTMPTYSDAELAWTNLKGVSVKMFRYCGAGLRAKEKSRVHPTQKPLSLMTWCLSFFPDAKTIRDPFLGSGTTLLAAKELRRQAIGIEIDEKYCEIAARRLQQEVLSF